MSRTFLACIRKPVALGTCVGAGGIIADAITVPLGMVYLGVLTLAGGAMILIVAGALADRLVATKIPAARTFPAKDRAADLV
jgi:hypothetical protein